MKKNLAAFLSSLHIGLVMLFGIIFAVYLFIGPFDPSTYVKMIFRFNNNLYNVYGILLLSYVICVGFVYVLMMGFAEKIGATKSLGESHRALLKAFMTQDGGVQPKKGYWGKVILILVLAFFIDGFHEGVVAFPTLVVCVIWYRVVLKYIR